ncbi:MAG: hypothetical protein RL523_288, partial [Actinomycetota bacterium]
VGNDGQDSDIMLQQTIAEDPASRERTFYLIDNYLAKVAKLI